MRTVIFLGLPGRSQELLKHLKGFKSLKRLRLEGADVSDEGIARLKRVLPGVQVYGRKTDAAPTDSKP